MIKTPTPIVSDVDELRDKCADIQLLTKLDDIQWKEQFGNDSGLYGFITSYTHDRETEARINELEHIAPDMRSHPEYKGYVETSISGKWKPLSERLAALKDGSNA